MQARRARLVADAGEVFDVFRLRQAFLQVARFVLALFEVQDGVLGFAEGAVEGLAVVGEVLLVAGFGFAARQFFFVRVQEGQGDVGGDGTDGVMQQFEQAVGAGAEVRAQGEVGVEVALGDGDVAEVLLQAVLGGAQVGALCEEMRRDAAVDGGHGQCFQAWLLVDDAADRCAQQAGEGGFGLLPLVFEAVAVGVEVGAVLFGFAQVERAGAAGVDFGAGEVEGLCGVFAVGGVQRQLVVE